MTAGRDVSSVGPAVLFNDLVDGCLQCGHIVVGRDCPDCGPPGRPPDATPDRSHIPPGSLVHGRLPWRRRPGIVLTAGGERITVLGLSGDRTERSRHGCRIVRYPHAEPPFRSAFGGLLAAAADVDLPIAVRAELRREAVARVRDSVAAQRDLAADCAALGSTDVLAELALSDGERSWWRSMSLWQNGDRPGACVELLSLPAGRYPQRLIMWWRALADGELPDAVRSDVVTAAGTFEQGTAAIAAAVLLRRLGERTGRCADAALADVAASLPGAPVESRIDGPAGDSPSARLLDVLTADSADERRLGTDPAVLDAAAPAVLDDLIDRGLIPRDWLDRADELDCGRYLLARNRIATLADAELAELGAHDERARRGLATAGILPDDLPDAVRDRFAHLPIALDGDDEALFALVRAAGLDEPALRAALDSTAPPDERLLADPSLANRLLDRSAVDVTALPVDRLTDRQRGFVARLALRDAKRLLYLADWPAALDSARTCLRYTDREDLRDEAHNLIAAAHWQLGNDDAAISALSAALDGEYTAALQVNFAVVAAELEPRRTAEHLSRLVLSAPDLPLRVSAAVHAIWLWGTDRPWTRGEPLPGELAAALRSLVAEPLEYPTFRDLIRLLANHDGDWLAEPRALAGSPHRHSWAARIWTANARDPSDFIAELVAASRTESEPWIGQLREQLLQDLLTQLNDAGPDRPIGFGLLLLEHDYPMPPGVRAVILGMCIGEALAQIDPASAEPSLRFLDWLERATAELAELPVAQQVALRAVTEAPFNALLNVFVESRIQQLSQARQFYGTVRKQIDGLPGYQINRYAVARTVRPGEELCRDTIALLDRMRRYAGPELENAIDHLTGACRDLLRRFAGLY